MLSNEGKEWAPRVDFYFHIITVWPKERRWLKGAKIRPETHLNRKQTVFASSDITGIAIQHPRNRFLFKSQHSAQ